MSLSQPVTYQGETYASIAALKRATGLYQDKVRALQLSGEIAPLASDATPGTPPALPADATATAIAAASEGRLLTRAEELQLGRLIRQGDAAARELLILKNDALVWSVVQRYRGRHLDADDLHGHGTEGLLRAVAKFDPERGHKFSTYATWWIRQAVSRALTDLDATIRTPVHLVDRQRVISRAAAAHAAAHGRPPTEAELCAATSLSPVKLALARDATRLATTISLDAAATAKDGEDRTLIDVLADPAADNDIHAYAEANERRQLLATLLASIPERHAAILRLRYGLDGAGERTLEQVGELLGLTRERVRQLEREAMGRMRETRHYARHAAAAD